MKRFFFISYLVLLLFSKDKDKYVVLIMHENEIILQNTPQNLLNIKISYLVNKHLIFHKIMRKLPQ